MSLDNPHAFDKHADTRECAAKMAATTRMFRPRTAFAAINWRAMEMQWEVGWMHHASLRALRFLRGPPV